METEPLLRKLMAKMVETPKVLAWGEDVVPVFQEAAARFGPKLIPLVRTNGAAAEWQALADSLVVSQAAQGD